MTTHHKNIPELRFKEFDGLWRHCSLGDVTKYTKGFAFKSEDYKNSGVRVVRVSDLGFDSIKIGNEQIYVSEAKIGEYKKYLLNEGNIIITTVGSKPELLESAVGRGIYVKGKNEGLLNQNLLKFENIQGVDNGFIMGLINTKKYQLHIKGIARGNANQANITVVDLLQYKVSIPSLPEQQKIASFLSAIDEKIQQLMHKKELLEQYKKGVMQQLLSGKLRFKDEKGKAYPTWEEKAFGSVSKFVNGKAYRQDELLNKGKYRVLRVGNLFSNNEWYYSDLELEEDKYIDNGDLIYAWSASFGPRFWEEEKVIYHYHIWKVIPSRYIDKQFLFHVFMFDVEKIKAVSQGGTMFHITKGNIESRLFEFPCLEEQQKVASFLTGIDSKIENVASQITQTQTFKKGLLQQMFV